MTTIVWDGTSLAVDSQTTAGGCKYPAEKAVRLSRGRVLALAGEVGHLPAVAALVAAGEGPGAFPKGDYAAVLAGPAGCLVADISTGDADWSPVTGGWATGSGSMAAAAGLALGFNAKQAAELACKVDMYSSGPVKVFRCVKG